MVKPKSSRGLGLRNLLHKNWALMANGGGDLVRRVILCGLFLNMVNGIGSVVKSIGLEGQGIGKSFLVLGMRIM